MQANLEGFLAAVDADVLLEVVLELEGLGAFGALELAEGIGGVGCGGGWWWCGGRRGGGVGAGSFEGRGEELRRGGGRSLEERGGGSGGVREWLCFLGRRRRPSAGVEGGRRLGSSLRRRRDWRRASAAGAPPESRSSSRNLPTTQSLFISPCASPLFGWKQRTGVEESFGERGRPRGRISCGQEGGGSMGSVRWTSVSRDRGMGSFRAT